MQVMDSVRTVLAVRRFADRSVPPDVIDQILAAARLTGSSMNRQPWHFVVVDDRETLRALGAIARTGPYTADAAFAVVVLIERTPYAVSDASRAVQSMVLTAWAAGVGSNWVGFGNFERGPIESLLGLPPELDALAIVPFGYPIDAIGRGRKNRKPQDAVVSHNRYGAPFRAGAD